MLIDVASCVKDLTDGRKLAGAFFGYPSITHEKVSRVIRSGKVDFFAAPPVYHAVREPGHSWRSQAYYQASYRLHNRVCRNTRSTCSRTHSRFPTRCAKR